MNYEEACKFLEDRGFQINAELKDEYIRASWHGHGASYHVRILCPEPESKAPWRVWFKDEQHDLYSEAPFFGKALAEALSLRAVPFNFALDELHEYPLSAIVEIKKLVATVGEVRSFYRRGADYVLDLEQDNKRIIVSGPCYMNEEAYVSCGRLWACSYFGFFGVGKTLAEAYQKMIEKIKSKEGRKFGMENAT